MTSNNKKGTCVTFGVFDGLHAGHKAVFNRLINEKESGYKPVIVIFDLNYQDKKCNQNKRLTTVGEMKTLAEKAAPGAELIFLSDYDCCSVEPENIIGNIIKAYDAKIIVCGSNCRFGKGGLGDVNLLRKLAYKYGYEVIAIQTICSNDGEAISSDLIKSCLLDADIEYANKMLGHHYLIRGEVVHGNKIGRKSGVPTMNLHTPIDKFIPAHGVYATVTEVNGKMYYGITNIGRRPTADSSKHITTETNLFNFNGDVYGVTIETRLCSYIRGVQKFGSLTELKKQIMDDINIVRGYFENAV